MDSSSNRSIFMVVYLYRSQIATESFGRKLMPVGEKKCLFVFKSIETFKVIIPGLDIFLTFNLSSNLDEIFGLKISEVTKFLMIDFDVILFLLGLMILLFRATGTHQI